MLDKVWKRQEFRFLLVGVLNTIVGYGIYAILVFFHIHYLIANTLSTVLGVLHSYVWNRYFTFQSKAKKGKEFLKFASVYVISYLIGTCTLYLFHQYLHIGTYVAGLINLVITTCVSYFGHKYFSFYSSHSDGEKPYRYEWGILTIITVFLFVSFIFGDILVTTNASIVFDKLLFTGHPFQLYEATYHTFSGILAGTNITYDIPFYIFFGIWNLPLAIITLITNFPWYQYTISLLYAKGFLVFLSFCAVFVMNKILTLFHLNDKDKKMYAFLFLSSSITFMVLYMFAGYDILPIVFILLGVYYYLKDDWKKFIFFFAVATSIKLFALFLFIPLLLLKEKNIWKIGFYTLCSMSLLLFSKLLYYHAPMYLESMGSFENSMLQKLNISTIQGPFGPVSIFVLLYALVCIWCYQKKEKDQKMLNLYTMYLGLVVYGSFVTFCQIHPQWLILVVPYLIFFLVYHKGARNLNILLETAFSGLAILLLYAIYDYVFSPGLMNQMLIHILFPRDIVLAPLPLIHYVMTYQGFVSALIFATFFYFLYINYPKNIENEKNEPWSHSLLLLRMCVILPFALLIVYTYFR